VGIVRAKKGTLEEKGKARQFAGIEKISSRTNIRPWPIPSHGEVAKALECVRAPEENASKASPVLYDKYKP
jgi:hypothetical protein